MSRAMFYITAETMREAEKIASLLVREKLAACVNIIPQVKSFFYWEGEVQNEEEIILVGKTRTVLVDKLVDTVKKNHPYDVPCIISWNLDGGNPDFLEWVDSETSRAG